MNRTLEYFRTAVGLALAQLRHDRMRTVLAVIGITLAVLSTTLLASAGIGVVETGQQKFDSAGRDLWITGGPMRFAPGTVGGLETSLTNSHQIAAEIGQRETVKTAVPMSFQTVYVGSNPENLQTILAVGVPMAGNGAVSMTTGRGFAQEDIHYANGTYSGPMTNEIIVDPRTARLLNLSINDTLYIGGTVSDAQDHSYTVVGISPTFSRFLGSPTVVLHLSELQTLTNTAREDRAAMITIDLKESANVSAIENDLQESYPQYTVRTNREQLQSVLQQKAVIIASGATLVFLAVVTGLMLTINLLVLLVYQQRETIAALRAIGVSRWPLVGAVGFQGLILGLIGGGLGLALTPPLAAALNAIASIIVGFEGLVQTPPLVFTAGAAIAVLVGVTSSIVAGWRVSSIAPLQHLER